MPRAAEPRRQGSRRPGRAREALGAAASPAPVLIVVDGPERQAIEIPDVAPAVPVTVYVENLREGRYTVTATHGSSRIQRVVVRGGTLEFQLVMP